MAKKGVVLIVSMVVMAMVLILTGVYFSGLLTEKRSADAEKFVIQALGLAEAGANHGISELREEIRTDLKTALEGTNVNQLRSDLDGYFAGQNPLGLLENYAQFTGNASLATLTLSALDLSTAVQGNYTATITVTPQPISGEITSNPEHPQEDTYIFYYNYIIDAQGNITATLPTIQKNISLQQGSFVLTVQRDTFSKFALFTNHHKMPSGDTVWFTANTNFTGPLHTNERFSFANNPSANFSAQATQHLTTARFYNNGSPRLLDADSNPPFDVPTFQAGFDRGVDEINLPSSITQQDLKDQATGNQNDGPWSSGIYLPNQNNSLEGGIYIKGNASDLTMSVDGNNRPVYTITQGTNTKKITVDYVNIQTIVENISGSGGTPAGTYAGIPDGVTNEGTIIYGNGSISNFSGTVQSDTELTVSSDSDIIINNHVKYQSFHDVQPPDALGFTNILGILTWNGNVRIGTSAPNDISIHGVVMAAGRNGVFTVDNYRTPPSRGTATLLGGAITDFYGPFGTFSGGQQRSGYGRNFVYDERMLEGTTPPFFPFLTNFTSFDDGGLENRLIWQDKGV